MKRLKRGRRVVIRWRDACSYLDSYWDKEPKMKLTRIKTVGYVWEDSRRYITVCQSLNSGTIPGGLVSIPKGDLKSIKTI